MSPLRIIDPHIHLWDLSTGLYPHFEKPSVSFIGDNTLIARSYLLPEFLEEGEGAVVIEGAVHVEALPTDVLRELEVLQHVAANAPIPIGVIAGGDLTDPRFGAFLDRCEASSSFRGVRQVLNRHPVAQFNYVATDFMADPQFSKGLNELGRRGGVFDLQIYPHQMDVAARQAAEAGGTGIVLNHAGMWVDRNGAGWRQYKQGLRTLAAEPNVTVKIGGLGMFDLHWTTESIRPLVLEALEAFGPDRSMFASNFPVDKLFSSYAAVWKAFDAITADLPEGDRAKLFRDNARRVYRL
ncbi:MAG: amidohydrolase family protein [Proteobacteria bacterium]|nr:amidohydrolase family protein [Pseudomonadota bacterium]